MIDPRTPEGRMTLRYLILRSLIRKRVSRRSSTRGADINRKMCQTRQEALRRVFYLGSWISSAEFGALKTSLVTLTYDYPRSPSTLSEGRLITVLMLVSILPMTSWRGPLCQSAFA